MAKKRDDRDDPAFQDPPDWAVQYDASEFDPFAWTADVVGLVLDADGASLHALVVTRGGEPFVGLDAWPGGFVEAREDADSRVAALRELREETGQADAGFMEELGTYGRLGRDPRQFAGFRSKSGTWTERGTRVVSTAHLALLRKEGRKLVGGDDATDARWADVYDFFPWEDLRGVRGRAELDGAVRALHAWAGDGVRGDERRERIDRAFCNASSDTGKWNEELVADRFRLLREAGLVEEARRDLWGRVGDDSGGRTFGRAMAFDHREIMADALGRLRGKMKYVPRVLRALVGERFTLDELQGCCEAMAGRPLHRANFRRTVAALKHAIVEPTGEVRESEGRGVDPQLFRFREQATAGRLDVSIRMPWLPLTSGE